MTQHVAFSKDTPIHPVSDSTPTVVVTEAQDNLRALLSQGKRHSVEINACCSVGEEGDTRCAGSDVAGTRREDDIGELHETQAQEPGSARHKEGTVAKDLLDQLRQDAWVRDQRMAERGAAAAAALADRDAANVTKLESLMKNFAVDIKIKHLSDTMDGKMATLEQRVQERWKTFEDKWSDTVVHPDDKETVTCNAEFRIRRAVQQDEDERWKKRMANEDKITTNAIHTLRSDFNKKSAKMADEVVSLKNRHQGCAASTVSGSTGSGGKVGNFASRMVQHTFVAS